ncbi:putative lipoprotein [Chromohalobacter marismortui]|uniref:Putative lipoprotein n=2 Tax=Halomonadaceae TaxID=28256 RepID=A0A4R7NM36_9GAMM|nr:putative lipoprotein [Chromohalobacter marismortui]
MISVAVVLLAVMAWDTTVVPIEAEEESGASKLAQFAEETFPEIRRYVEENAVSVGKLASAIEKDKSAAAERYGVPSGIGSIIPVTVTGVVGKGESGTYEIKSDEVPDDVTIRVQTGPAIYGTALRDATGKIEFGQFKNQIEYQNAGSALNNAMKAQVLSDIDTQSLKGKTVTVKGVFQLINPANWLITPVAFDVK